MHEQCTIDKKLFVKKSQFSSVRSNVVEKCVSNALLEERAALIREVCQPEAGDRCVPFWRFGHSLSYAMELCFWSIEVVLTHTSIHIQLPCYWSDDQGPVCQLCCPGKQVWCILTEIWKTILISENDWHRRQGRVGRPHEQDQVK